MRIPTLALAASRSRSTLHRCTAAAMAVSAAFACPPTLAQVGPTGTHGYVPGRLLVMPRAGLSEGALSSILKENGAGNARQVGRSALRIVELGVGGEPATLQRLLRNPHIKFAELDQLTRPEASVSDPYAGSEWHLAKIGAYEAWNQSQGQGLTIAILDTGVDATHPDLVSRLVRGWNFFNNSADTSDAYNHGTKVAGSAAAAMNNSIGVAGVSGQTMIMPLRISDASGYGSWAAMAQALTYAADHGARVANISFSSAATSASVLSAAQYMKDKGGLVFVSAGNTGATSTAQATKSAIVVAATDSTDARAGYSTYGPVVSLSAPGSAIYTTLPGGAYGAVSGTSFASPITAAVAALVMAANPALSSTQVENILFSTAGDLGTAGRDDYYGHGRVDAAAAVQAAINAKTVAPSDTQAPTAAVISPSTSNTVSALVPVNVTTTDNVGVTKVELRVNGKTVTTDTVSPFAFSWDSATVANGMNSIAVVAYDAAGNAGASSIVSLNVVNNATSDFAAPVVTIVDPVNGSRVSGNVTVSASASDNAGSAGITQTLFINGQAVAKSVGASLSYRWQTRKAAPGSHVIRVEAHDAAGNMGAASSTVTR